MTDSYTALIVTENHIPSDVLADHLQNSLRDFRFAGDTSVAIASHKQTKPHPFDGPVVFDDEPADPFPLVTRVVEKLRGRKG